MVIPVNLLTNDSVFPVEIIRKPVYVINNIKIMRIKFIGMLNDAINPTKAIAVILSNKINFHR